MNPQQMYDERLASTVMKNMNRRGMESFYCATADEAREMALSLIAPGSSVAFGGSMTLEECGMIDALRAREDICLYDRSTAKSPEEVGRIYRQAFSADTFLMSSNAITADGELINIDGTGNRVAALIYGPAQVIIIAGMNKIAADEREGMSRARNVASPLNCIRLNKKTPCAVTGRCGDCSGDESICCQIVVTRRSREKGRIKVILVGEKLGY